MSLKTLLIATVFLSGPHAFASFLNSDLLEIKTAYKLELAPDCRNILLSAEQHRILREALALHKKETTDTGHDEFTLTKTYKLTIKGTAHSIDITEREKTLLEVLLSSEEPVRHLSVRGADELIHNLNVRSLNIFKKSLIDVSSGQYSLHRGTGKASKVTVAENKTEPPVASGIKLTPKQKILVEAIYSSEKRFLTYEEIGFVMAWRTGDLPRKTGEFMSEINRASFIKTGLPLLKSVRGNGVAVAAAETKAIPTVGRIVNTKLGAFPLNGKALLVAKAINFESTPEGESEFLTVSARAFEKISLSESELIKTLSQINKEAVQRFGKPLFTYVDLELGSFKTQYRWVERTKKLDFPTGWNRKSNRGPRITII